MKTQCYPPNLLHYLQNLCWFPVWMDPSAQLYLDGSSCSTLPGWIHLLTFTWLWTWCTPWQGFGCSSHGSPACPPSPHLPCTWAPLRGWILYWAIKKEKKNALVTLYNPTKSTNKASSAPIIYSCWVRVFLRKQGCTSFSPKVGWWNETGQEGQVFTETQNLPN